MVPQEDNYEVVTLPLDYNRSFLELGTTEIKSFQNWFLEIKGKRLQYICEFLFETRNCLDEENLSIIELFLANSISTEAKSKEQLKTEATRLPLLFKEVAKPDPYVLDKRTISVCFDLSIYLGELAISLDKQISWLQENNLESADYGQMVLYKQGCRIKINPFRVTKNLAVRIYEENFSEGDFQKTFRAWKKSYGIE